jgi:predicted Zn-dependent protease
MKATPLEATEALLLLGDFFQHGGQPELSETTLAQARASGAGASATERRSLGLLRQQQFAAAEAMADEALKEDGQLAIARYVRAVATMAQSADLPPERANRAEADLRAAIQIEPGLARAHAVLGGLLATARNRPQDGLVFARRALELEPSELAHRIALAQVLLLDDQPAEARWLATHVVRRAGSDSERAAGERLLALASEAEARLAGVR